MHVNQMALMCVLQNGQQERWTEGVREGKEMSTMKRILIARVAAVTLVSRQGCYWGHYHAHDHYYQRDRDRDYRDYDRDYRHRDDRRDRPYYHR